MAVLLHGPILLKSWSMKNINHSTNTNQTNNHTSKANPWTPESLATIRTTAREYANPVDYKHPYPSMARFADHLALRYDANRTRHSYYRQRSEERRVGKECRSRVSEDQLKK